MAKRKSLEDKLRAAGVNIERVPVQPLKPKPEREPINDGDVIQVTRNGNQHIARLGIVHHQRDDMLICYTPGRAGHPNKFVVDIEDVTRCGRAAIKYNKPLPDEDTTDTALDAI